MMKDIVRRHKIRDVDLLSRVIGYVMSETGYVFSAASILLPNVRFTQALKRDLDARKETIWFAGCDEQLLCALALGNVFSGGIGTTYNIIPRHFARICDLAEKNDFRAAAKLQDEANQVVRLMIESDNWSHRKAMMKLVGIDVGPCRAPFERLSPAKERAFLRRVAKLPPFRRA